jgi:hypothetical protein
VTRAGAFGELVGQRPALEAVARQIDLVAPAGPDAERVLTDAEVRRLEADNLRPALRRARGKVSGTGGAAELLGVKPTTLASRIKALGLAPGPADPVQGEVPA